MEITKDMIVGEVLDMDNTVASSVVRMMTGRTMMASVNAPAIIE